MEIAIEIGWHVLFAIGAVVSFLWNIVVWLFWAAVGFIGLVLLIALFRPTTLSSSRSPSVEAMRAALRSGELDADIARVNARNNSRGAP